MIKIFYAPTFVRMYKHLDPALQREVKEKIELFKNKTNHKRLAVHKLHGIEKSHSFSVNYKIRIVFEYQGALRVNLLYVGDHCIYQK